jgi:hypothetical protein
MKIFISHSSSDKKFVRTLKDDLTENGFETWFDEDELEFGDSLTEKLEAALDETSHFLIVLTPTAVNSEWVKLELNRALKNRSTHLLDKIIPVKYLNCHIPTELDHLLFANLSDEVRKIEKDKVTFVSQGYDNFLNKLCKGLKKSDHKLTNSDKDQIKKELIEENIKQPHISSSNIIKAIYNVKGYTNLESKLKFRNIVAKQVKLNTFSSIEEIRPILLPPLLKTVFNNINIGDKIFFFNNYINEEFGHFAGFRKDDLSITIESRIREGISIQSKNKYNTEIDVDNKRITFLN